MKYFMLLASIVFSMSVFANEKATAKLAEAVENNNLKRAKSAIEDGADVNSRSTTSTIFLRAVKLNNIEMVKLLLDNKADINQVRPVDRFSGLMITAKTNNPIMAKFLISKGINPNLVTVAARNALHIAALQNSIEVAKVLVEESSININAREGLCALAVAARQDHRKIVTLLKNLTGEKAPSAACIEKAIDMADFNDHAEVLKILRG